MQVFWNVDIIATFLTGYYEDGNLVLRPAKTLESNDFSPLSWQRCGGFVWLLPAFSRIAWNYLKTWFGFDLTVVSQGLRTHVYLDTSGVDWIILFMAADSDAQGVHRLSKTVRLLRFLRMVRILRLAKISRMSEAVQEQIQSQTANIHYSLFKSTLQ